jgi:hypothetical protein
MKVTLRFYDRMDECKLNTTLCTWALAGIKAINLERELTVCPARLSKDLPKMAQPVLKLQPFQIRPKNLFTLTGNAKPLLGYKQQAELGLGAPEGKLEYLFELSIISNIILLHYFGGFHVSEINQ